MVMMMWAQEYGVGLRVIEPGKRNRNAYAESFNKQLRDESLNERWLRSPIDVRALIETWRRD